MGGGTSLDLIHEIDYLTYLFGPPREIFNLRGQVSNLEIDCEDISTYLIKFNNTVSQVYLDYFGRKDIRKFLLITTQNTIEIDLLKNKICFSDSDETILFDETRDDFQIEEIKHFLRIINKEIDNDNDLDTAINCVKYTYGRI